MRDRGRDTQRDNRAEWEGEKRCWTLSEEREEGKGREPHWEHYPTLYGQRARSVFPHSSCKQRAFWCSLSLKDMDDYSIMWPQSSPCRSHVHRSHTQSYTRRHIQSHITDGKETFGQREAVCAPAETKICKNVQSFLEISMCMHTNEYNMSFLEQEFCRQHTLISAKRDMGSIQPLSLYFASAEHSEKQREAEKHVMQEGAYCAMKGTDGTSHKPLGPSFSWLPKKKSPSQTATLALLIHKAPLLLHPLRSSEKDVKVSMCNLAGRDSFMCD